MLTLVVNLAIVFSLAVGASFAQWVILKRRLTPIWKNAEEELGAAATLEGANIPGVWRCQSSLQRSHVIARNQSVYPKIEWRVGVLKIVATFVLGISISLDGIPNFVRSKLDALATKMYDLDGPEILAGKKIP